MAQAALRIEDDAMDTSIVRRLMARPLRVVPAPVLVLPESETIAVRIESAPTQPAAAPAPTVEVVGDRTATDLSRLKAEVMVMKAVLGAERRESERLRACLARMEDPETLSPEARAVRDRWAALVDLILDTPR